MPKLPAKPVILFFTCLFFLSALFLVHPTKTDAVCYCVNPDSSNCSCTTSADEAGATFDSSFAGVPIRCTDERETGSMFAIKDPVCSGGGWINESIPDCSYIVGDHSKLTCWGTGFSSFPHNLDPQSQGDRSFLSTYDYAPWSQFRGSSPVIFGNGSWTGVADIWTCWENVTCCGLNCEQTGNQTGFTGRCGDPPNPPPRPVDPKYLSACAQGPTRPGANTGGESRLWFSQTRLIAALSSMAQSFFNPFKLNDRYQNNAFSKNSAESNASGEIDNETAFTTRVEKHQGIDDSTPVVNTTDNNSSMISGRGAPPPLYPFGNTTDDNPYNDSRACYLPETRTNPGDDLIGPKITAELTFTQQFSYEAHAKPLGCTEDGQKYTNRKLTPTTTPCSETCCSEICIADEWTQPCIKPSPSGCGGWPIGSPFEAYTFSCLTDPNDFSTELCCSGTLANEWCIQTTESGVCGKLPDIERSISGEVVVYSKTPMIEHIYDTIVTGADSLYRRFLPYLGKNPDFEEIPSSATFRASASVASTNSPVSFQIGDGQTSTPTIYFPHIGSLDKYWLEEFQASIRPQGFGRAELPTDKAQTGLPGIPNPPPAGSCANSPAPYSQELNNTISAAITRYGSSSATAAVPGGVLKAIYFIESFGQWNNQAYNCSYNSLGPSVGILGLMQVGNTAYNLVVPPNQRMSDVGQCQYQPGKMSRCNPVDAIEIAARVLLYKVGKWNFGAYLPTNAITTVPEVYCAAAGYYGSTTPDSDTDARGQNRSVSPANDGRTNYSEVVCYDSGICANGASDYPWPRPSAKNCLNSFP